MRYPSSKRIPVWSIVLYVLAALLMIYAAYGIIHHARYIADLVAEDEFTMLGNEFETIQYILGNGLSLPNLALSAVLFALGYLIQRNAALMWMLKDRPEPTAPGMPGPETPPEADPTENEETQA